MSDAISPSPLGKGGERACRLNLSLLTSSAAALPPDVREGFAFPVKFKITARGYAPLFFEA